MFRIPTIALVALIAFVPLHAGCGGGGSEATYSSAQPKAPAPRAQLAKPANTKSLHARDLVGALSAAGLEVQDLGAATIDMDDLSRFPEEPRSTVVLRLRDSQGSEAMTFVEFGSWKAAATVDAKPINGFAVRNWFVMGTVSNRYVELVRRALDN